MLKRETDTEKNKNLEELNSKYNLEELFNNIEYEFTNYSFDFSLPLRNGDPPCRTRRYVESGCKSKWESSQYIADKFND